MDIPPLTRVQPYTCTTTYTCAAFQTIMRFGNCHCPELTTFWNCRFSHNKPSEVVGQCSYDSTSFQHLWLIVLHLRDQVIEKKGGGGGGGGVIMVLVGVCIIGGNRMSQMKEGNVQILLCKLSPSIRDAYKSNLVHTVREDCPQTRVHAINQSNLLCPLHLQPA